MLGPSSDDASEPAVSSYPDPPEREVVARRTLDGERLIAVFSSLVEPLGQSLPASTEVVLHDLSLLPNSIVAVYGNVTGRRVGDPSTDLLLEQSVSGFRSVLGYQGVLHDGRIIRSSTIILRDVFDQPIGALCINSDVSAWSVVEQVARSMMGETSNTPSGALARSSEVDLTVEEAYASNVEELAAHLIKMAVGRVGVPVEYMKKENKVEVVRDLKERGMFLIREAVEMVAESLNVTRFTIYNYLNELSSEEKPGDQEFSEGTGKDA